MAGVVVTKTINIEGVASVLCVEVAPGNWCWTTPGFNWKWSERIAPPQFNFAMQMGDHFHYSMRTKCIEDAVVYAQGFSYGYKNGYTHGEEDRTGVDGMVEQIRQERAKEEAIGLPPKTEEKA